MASRKATGAAGYDADEIDEGRGVADFDGSGEAEVYDDTPIDGEFDASRAVTTMEFDVGDIEFDVGEKNPGQARKGRGRKGKRSGREGTGAAPGLGGLLGAELTGRAALGGILPPAPGSARAPGSAGTAGRRAASGSGQSTAATARHTPVTAATAATGTSATRASSSPAATGKAAGRGGSSGPGKTIVSVSGQTAALARRRGRQRIKKTATALPHVPKQLWEAVARVELAHEVRKAAKKRAKGSTGEAHAAGSPSTMGSAAIAADELSVAVLGHVDSGKSTIIGHTLALCGIVGRRELHLNSINSETAGKGSFAHAWALDRGEEERERGITIDVSITRIIAGDSVQRSAPGYTSTAEDASAAAGLGSACTAVKASGASALLPLLNRPLCILDAPGHNSLVSGAVMAAAHADVALLVVPATTGEFETAIAGGGTAREHCIAARSLGLSRVVVAVNKMDAVDWSQERFDAIRTATAALLCTELKSSPNHVVFVPMCGISGVNIVTTLAEAAAATGAAATGAAAGSMMTGSGKSGLDSAAGWYSIESMLCPGAKLGSTGLVGLAGTSAVAGSAGRGLTLLETLRCIRPCSPKDVQEALKPLRLCVSDVYANEAAGIGGTVVVGRIASGWLQPRTEVVAAPGVTRGKGASVRMVRCAGSAEAEDRDLAFAGQTVELVLGGVPEDMVLRCGSVLAWPSHPIPVVMEAKCRISMMPATVVGSDSASRDAASASSSASSRGTSGGSAGGWDDAGGSGGYRVAPLLPIATGSRLHMQGMSVDAACTVTRILALLDKDDAVVKHRPRVLKQGQRALVRIRFESRVPIEAVKHHKRLGRFLLRQGSRSAATGTVLRVYK